MEGVSAFKYDTPVVWEQHGVRGSSRREKFPQAKQQDAGEPDGERRLALYADRAATDERIESSVAAVFMDTAARERAPTAVGRAEDAMAKGECRASDGVSSAAQRSYVS